MALGMGWHPVHIFEFQLLILPRNILLVILVENLSKEISLITMDNTSVKNALIGLSVALLAKELSMASTSFLVVINIIKNVMMLSK